jgi:hypothetical protein
MAHFISDGQPANLVQVGVGRQVEVQLWGDGPGGNPLDVAPSAPIVQVDEVQASFASNVRVFKVRGVAAGSTRLLARAGPGGAIWADTRVIVGRTGLHRYYHGTYSSKADSLIGDDLTPWTIPSPAIMREDWEDYTDFGKGFYVHLEANKKLAYDRAKEKYGADWAVVELIATSDELIDIAPTALYFQDKKDRPSNAPHPVTITTTTLTLPTCPQFLPLVPFCPEIIVQRTTRTISSTPMSWLEFVEYNRHVDRRGPLIARPNDRDWTGQYSSMRGPLWVPRDSGYPVGHPLFPDHTHQLNWGLGGLAVLNTAELKTRRFKFSSANEGLFPPPA